MIEIKNVSKDFKGVQVLENVSLKLEDGKIYGIAGRNGSGKSVLLKMIAGLLYPSDGQICIDGERLKRGTFAKDAGVLLDGIGFLPFYTAKENLSMIAKIRKVAGEDEICAVLEKVGLDPSSRKVYRKFSLGMKQKLSIAQAFMERPRILLLDEPMNALDEESVGQMRMFFREYTVENHAVMVVTSHNREDMETLADEVYQIGTGGRLYRRGKTGQGEEGWQ